MGHPTIYPKSETSHTNLSTTVKDWFPLPYESSVQLLELQKENKDAQTQTQEAGENLNRNKP